MDRHELLELAAKYFILDDGTSDANLVRRIQRAENSLDCFATVRARHCNDTGCRWRNDCVECANATLSDGAADEAGSQLP